MRIKAIIMMTKNMIQSLNKLLLQEGASGEDNDKENSGEP
jgi:hypothetical protein